MFKSKKVDGKKPSSRALKVVASPVPHKMHTQLEELLRECGMDEYLPSLSSIGIVTIDDLGRCSDDIVCALSDGRVVQHRKMSEVVKAVQKAAKGPDGNAMIRVGSVSNDKFDGDTRSTPHSPGRNVEQLSKPELVRLVNEQKKLVTSHQEELISLHTRLENEVKMRYNVQSLVESYKSNEVRLNVRIEELGNELKLTMESRSKYSFEPETPNLLVAKVGIIEPETPQLLEPETPNIGKNVNKANRSSSSSSLNSGKSGKNGTMRHSGSNAGKKNITPRASAISPPRFKNKKSIEPPNKIRSNSGSSLSKNSPRSLAKGTSPDSPSAGRKTSGRTTSPRRLSDVKVSNDTSNQIMAPETPRVAQAGEGEDPVLTFEEKMFSKSKRSPLKARVQPPAPLDTARPRTSKSSPRSQDPIPPRTELRSYKPTNVAKQSSSGDSDGASKVNGQVKSPKSKRLSTSMPRVSDPNGPSTQTGIHKADSWNHQNSLGDDTLESKIMRGASATEPSFEQKLLSEHRRKSKSHERGSVSNRKILDKQESLEDKVITAAYDQWITVSDAEAFKGAGAMMHLFFEGNEGMTARVSLHEVIEENDGMMKELREMKQEEEREKAVATMRALVKQKHFTNVILCGVMSGICPSSNPRESTYLLPHMLGMGEDGHGLSAGVCAFVRRSDVVTFRQAWGKYAQDKQIKISLYAVPDRLTQQQASLYVFSRTQASSLAFFSNSLVDAFTPQTATLLSRLTASGAPDGCHQFVFLPAVSSMIRPLVDESGINEMQDVTIIHSPA